MLLSEIEHHALKDVLGSLWSCFFQSTIDALTSANFASFNYITKQDRYQDHPILPTANKALIATHRAEALSIVHGTSTPAQHQFVHEAILHHSRANPFQVAAIHQQSALTYQDLDNMSYNVSQFLVRHGVGRETRVCLLVERSLTMLVGILGTLRAGASYIPLDGHIITSSALKMILRDSNAAMVLVSSKFLDQVKDFHIPSINLESLQGRKDMLSGSKMGSASPEMWYSDEAYVIYTSGTTGRLKGVTIVNTMHWHTPGSILTIRGPTPNNSIYVLDDEHRPVPVGIPRHLWAGGWGICRGYVGHPELNAERFQPDPFSPYGTYMFDTGDLGICRIDGEIEFLRRLDDQVKIKGFRVELDGIAHTMLACLKVKAACAMLCGDKLVSFYSPSDVEEGEVRQIVSESQPYYAIPVQFIAISSFPMTSNGKINKQKLHFLAESILFPCLLNSAYDDSQESQQKIQTWTLQDFHSGNGLPIGRISRTPQIRMTPEKPDSEGMAPV
ncbi:hypothetical protein EVG20_g10108 [Dentipellis fragilis]|uniref:AMP-dependent synthetase/ligase domain-containing protein n=1 Tax=Dentipellis fragilis TaxID=205917 RepID=A0A4Y9XVK4_9AGAM|nr:hypothetical protein EVG20_g10108 [Dentipellis fragilis]